jgi:thiol-disulfide isomerase/thioredoxin
MRSFWRLVRLVGICIAFAAAAVAIPTGGALIRPGPGGGGASAATADLVSAVKGPERQLISRGRRHPAVGRSAPSLDFRSIDGGPLPLSDAGRAVVLTFVSTACTDCVAALSTLSQLSASYFEEAYFAGVITAGGADDLARMLDEAGGTGLVLGAEDEPGGTQKTLGISSYPSTVVVGPKGTVDAVWSGLVPPNVLYKFLTAAYGLKRG